MAFFDLMKDDGIVGQLRNSLFIELNGSKALEKLVILVLAWTIKLLTPFIFIARFSGFERQAKDLGTLIGVEIRNADEFLSLTKISPSRATSYQTEFVESVE